MKKKNKITKPSRRYKYEETNDNRENQEKVY